MLLVHSIPLLIFNGLVEWRPWLWIIYNSVYLICFRLICISDQTVSTLFGWFLISFSSIYDENYQTQENYKSSKVELILTRIFLMWCWGVGWPFLRRGIVGGVDSKSKTPDFKLYYNRLFECVARLFLIFLCQQLIPLIIIALGLVTHIMLCKIINCIIIFFFSPSGYISQESKAVLPNFPLCWNNICKW